MNKENIATMSQIVTLEKNSLRFQNGTSKERDGKKYLPNMINVSLIAIPSLKTLFSKMDKDSLLIFEKLGL